MANEAIEVEWLVLEILWWGKYKVQIIDMDMQVEAYAAWKMKKFRIKIIPWDLVTVELNTYEPTKWRIVYRTVNTSKKRKERADQLQERADKAAEREAKRAAREGDGEVSEEVETQE